MGGAREGRCGMIYPSIVVTSTTPCFSRGAGGACVLVSIQGGCCLVRPIAGAAHRALSAGFVIRVVSPKTTEDKECGPTYSPRLISPLPSATSFPLSPIQYNPHLPRPGTRVDGCISTRAPMPPDRWQEVACPAWARTNGTHMS